MTSAAASTPPVLRSDAARNREAILAAARRVFAEEGIEAPLTRIAEVAGVGRGSLYRRFPDRESLVLELFGDNFDELEQVSEALRGRPGRFAAVFGRLLEQCLQSQGFLAVAFVPHRHLERFEEQGRRLDELVDGPLREAQAAGELPGHWRTADIGLVLGMISGILSGYDATDVRPAVARCLDLLGLAEFLPE